MLNLTNKCTTHIVSRNDLHDLVDQAEAGDANAYARMDAIENFLEHKTTGEPWKCWSCDMVFEGSSEIGVFVIARPRGRKNKLLYTGAICSCCAENGEDLKKTTQNSLQRIEAVCNRELN